jgi:hypothetical protein
MPAVHVALGKIQMRVQQRARGKEKPDDSPGEGLDEASIHRGGRLQ